MQPLFHGLQWEPTQNLGLEEVSLTLRIPGSASQSASSEKHGSLRPNLIARVLRTKPDTDLDTILQDMCAEIQNTASTLLQDFTVQEFVFADQSKGHLISFVFAFRGVALQQYHAVRLDNDLLTTLTLTVDAKLLNESSKHHYLSALASAQKIS